MKYKQLILAVLLVALVAGGGPVRGWAEDLGGSVMRDYAVALPLPEGRLEIGADYLMLHEGLDPFGFVEENRSGEDWGPGELNGLRLLANYGLSRRVSLKSRFQYRDVAFGSEGLAVQTVDLGGQFSLVNQRDVRVPKIALDVGGRFDWADHATDGTFAARLTAGRVLGPFFPNAYAEYGYTIINGDAAGAQGEPLSLSRNEHVIKAGLSLLVKFPYRALLHLEYQYVHVFRDEGLDLTGDNNILKADLSYFVTPAWVINVGGVYFDKQFNGEIPLLYHAATQAGFDGYYGYFYLGLSRFFNLH